MKMTRICKIALTAILSVGLAYGAAQAKDADDDISVYNWGPWGKMITPAAGAPPAFVTQLPEGFDYQSALNPRLVVSPAAVVTPPAVEPPPVEPPPVEPPIEARHHNRHRHGHGNNGNGATY